MMYPIGAQCAGRGHTMDTRGSPPLHGMAHICRENIEAWRLGAGWGQRSARRRRRRSRSGASRWAMTWPPASRGSPPASRSSSWRCTWRRSCCARRRGDLRSAQSKGGRWRAAPSTPPTPGRSSRAPCRPLRRFAGERAPRAAQVAIADLPLLLLEACAAAAVLGAGAVAAGGAGLWLALCVTTAACGALLAARTSLARLAPGPRRAGWQCSGTSRAGRRSRRWWWRSPRSAWRACGSCSTRSGCPQTPVTLRSSSRAWACSGCCRSDHPPRRAQPWRPPTAPGSARPWRPDWP